MGVLVVLCVVIEYYGIFCSLVLEWMSYVGIEIILCKYIDMFGMVYIYNGY